MFFFENIGFRYYVDSYNLDAYFKYEVKALLNNNNALTRCQYIDASTTRSTDAFDAKWTAVGTGTNMVSDSTCTSVGTNK